MEGFVYKEKSKRRGTNNSPSIFNNFVTRVVLLVVSVFLLYNVVHSVNITIQKLNILQRARMEVDELRLKNLEFALLLENIQGVEYLEIQARDRLNFAGEKEYVFVIPEDVLDNSKEDLDKFLGLEVEQDLRGGYEIWSDFLFNGI
jgi:cell division protein FtsB